MTGRITVLAGGRSISLLFGMLAVEEFSRRMESKKGTNSEAKVIYDLVYAGQLNHAIVKETEALSYEEVCEVVDDLIVAADPILKEISTCFSQSKFIAKATADVKKNEVVKPTKKLTGAK